MMSLGLTILRWDLCHSVKETTSALGSIFVLVSSDYLSSYYYELVRMFFTSFCDIHQKL